MEFEQLKETQPILAICYDFDKTLSPDDMQSQGYIQSVEYDAETFWRKSNKLAEQNHMDQNLAYMLMMVKEAHGKLIFNEKSLKEYGRKVKLFPGVDSWFHRINSFGRNHGIDVKHYIISSGLKEMIEGTRVASEFDAIYASSFYYDKDGVAIWPSQVVNYTNKTQFLFRIEKGALDVNDSHINDFVKPEDYTVPFRNMIYIGDSDTDIPCMKLVNAKGGYSIGVYNPEANDKSKVFKMMHDERIRYFAPADYTEGHELENLAKNIIERTETNERLERFHVKCLYEMKQDDRQKSDEEKQKEILINQLEESGSFKTTHDVISRLSAQKMWSPEQKERLLHIALTNHQVTYVLTDQDVKVFYEEICKDYSSKSADEIKAIIDGDNRI